LRWYIYLWSPALLFTTVFITARSIFSIFFFLQLFERFRPGEEPPASLGASRDYNVDLVPKFIMVRKEKETQHNTFFFFKVFCRPSPQQN
jgi:hypothetical protein